MDEHDEDEGAVFPLAVTIAGWVWVVQGFVWMIASFGLLSLGGNIGVCLGLFTFAAAVRLCMGGHEVIHGEAKDLIYATIVSILIGGPLLAYILAVGAAFPLVAQVGIGVVATSLVAAGLLAMFGRGAYLRWRREHVQRAQTTHASDERPPEPRSGGSP